MLQALSKKGTDVEQEFGKIMNLPTETNARLQNSILTYRSCAQKQKFEDEKQLKKNMNFLNRKMSLKIWKKKIVESLLHNVDFY